MRSFFLLTLTLGKILQHDLAVVWTSIQETGSLFPTLLMPSPAKMWVVERRHLAVGSTIDSTVVNTLMIVHGIVCTCVCTYMWARVQASEIVAAM